MCALWGALLPLGAPQSSHAQAEDLLDEGLQLLAKGRLNEAVAAFNHFKQTAPQDARPYFYSGMALAEAKRLSDAASELKEAVRLAPDRPEYRVLQGDVSCRIKQKAAAATALAIFEKPGYAEQLSPVWLKLLADVYYRLGKAKDALGTLDLLAERTPNDPDIDLNRGRVYVLLKRSNLAMESFKKSIEKSATNPVAYFELGKVYYERNELPAAREALLEAVSQDAANPEYLYKLGVVCLARGEVEEAIQYLKRAEPSAFTLPEIYNALGRAYRHNADRAKADAYLKKFQEVTLANRKKDDWKWAVERLIYQGEMQLDGGNKEAAKTLFEQAIRADPDRWDGHGYLAEMLLDSQDWQLAYPHLAKMEEIDPDSVVGNHLIATYWYKRKDFERALVYAEKVKVSRPGNSELRNLLGKIYMGLGQKEKALQEYEAAVRLAPERPDFRENLRSIENQHPEVTESPPRP